MASASAVECTATVGDAELLAGAQDPERDLAAIGDQDLVEHRGARAPVRYSMITSGSPYSTGWPLPTKMAVTHAGLGRRDVVHGLHRLDDQDRLPLRDPGADLDEGGAPGSGAR